ncbi:hypothetical protein BGZ98_005364, partial [Dissophora globulifera]
LTNSKKTDIVKNIPYGGSGNLLDIYIGSPASSPVNSPLASPSNANIDDDAGSDHTVESNGSPVIIYVYSGSWDSGHKSMMMPMAQNLANQGYLVVVPDYKRYPQAKIEDMVRDVQDAVVWTTVNATRYGGDPANIYLMGSGSGAHVASLAIMHDAAKQLGVQAVPNVQGDSTPIVNLPLWPDMPTSSLEDLKSHHHHHHQHHHDLQEQQPLLRERVRGLILFSGVFDITFYYAYLHNRGIEEVSAMPRVMHQSANNYLACSPSWILSTATAETADRPELLEQVLPKSILLIHGEKDRLIPAHSSQTLFNLLCAAEIPNIKFKIYTGQSNLDPAIDLILPSNAITAALLNDVADVIRPWSSMGGAGYDGGYSTGSSTPNGMLDDDEEDSQMLKHRQDQYTREFSEGLMRDSALAY